jgi:hypothetical protein
VFNACLAVGATGVVDLAATPEDLAALEAYDTAHGLPARRVPLARAT